MMVWPDNQSEPERTNSLLEAILEELKALSMEALRLNEILLSVTESRGFYHPGGGKDSIQLRKLIVKER